MTKIEKMLYNSEANMLGKKHAVAVEDWKATIYSVDGKIVEENIESFSNRGGDDWFVFHSNSLNRYFIVSTSDGQAQFVKKNDKIVQAESPENLTMHPYGETPETNYVRSHA